MEEFNYNKNTFTVIDKMLENNYIVRKIQLDSFNDFVKTLIPIIITQYNPLTYKFSDEHKKYELILELKNPRLIFPEVSDNDGTVNELTTQLARLRNYTYSSKLIVDIVKRTNIYDKDNNLLENDERVLSEKNIGRIPLMVNSQFCVNSFKKKEIWKDT